MPYVRALPFRVRERPLSFLSKEVFWMELTAHVSGQVQVETFFKGY